MDTFREMLQSVMAPVLARLGNLAGTGTEIDAEDVEFIPVGDGACDSEDDVEEKTPAPGKPKRIQIDSNTQGGVQKPLFSKGKENLWTIPQGQQLQMAKRAIQDHVCADEGPDQKRR